MKFMILAALAAVALPMAANAAKVTTSADGSPQTTVAIGDLDLARPAGATTALSRIRNAASDVCGEAVLPTELAKAHWRRVCMAHATQAAVHDLDAPLVTARYFKATPGRALAAN
jgi:UrcA family protein